MSQRRVARALADVAEDLIIGAVLADDVHDVLHPRRFTGPLGNRAGDGVAARRERRRIGAGAEREPVVLRDAGRIRRELRLRRNWNDVHRAANGVHVAALERGGTAGPRTDAEQRSDGERLSVGAHVKCRWIPSGGNQAPQAGGVAGGDIVNRDGVHAAERDEQRRTIRRERDGSGCESYAIEAERRHGDGGDHGI